MNLAFARETTNDAPVEHFAEFKEGVELLKNKYSQKALEKLRCAFESDKRNPYYISFLGLAIARAQRKWAEATELCETAVQLNPREVQFHLNLGEVYVLAGQRERAIHKLDYAMRLFGKDARLKQARSKVEKCRAPWPWNVHRNETAQHHKPNVTSVPLTTRKPKARSWPRNGPA